MITKINVEGGSGNVPSGPMQFNNDWCGVFLRGDYLDGFFQEISYLKDLDVQSINTSRINKLFSFRNEATSEAGAKMTPERFILQLRVMARNYTEEDFALHAKNLLEEYKE